MASNGAPDSVKFIVAIDFGTTFSGFAYAHTHPGKTDPGPGFLKDVEVFEQWSYAEEANGTSYFKTQTSLLYMQTNSTKDAKDAEYEVVGWGWEAFVKYRELLQKSEDGESLDGKRFHFLTKFKLHLAGVDHYNTTPTAKPKELPEGFTVDRVIADYLHKLSIVIEEELQNKSVEHISKRNIQWCLTVPAMWGEVAKQRMRKCAEMADLVSGHDGEASPHPIIIVLEPEGASAYGLDYLQEATQSSLPAGSKILVVDAGGGTVDLVFHEKVDDHSFQVKEVSEGNSGGLCGGTFVDIEFEKLLSKRIPCYKKFALGNPAPALKIGCAWENIKHNFDAKLFHYQISIPSRLIDSWKKYNKENGLPDDPDMYDSVVSFTVEEMQSVFDSGAVNAILNLIEEQLAKVLGEDVHALLVVGGFSGSRYLMDRIREKFKSKTRIVNPSFAGKAVVAGAIAYGYLGKQFVTKRNSPKTYGIAVFGGRTDSGELRGYKFKVFVKKGQELLSEEPYTQDKFNVVEWYENKECTLELKVYSTTKTNPVYVNDPEVVQECTYDFKIPPMNERPRFRISMFFGRPTIEMTAEGINFKTEKAIRPTITFDKQSLC